MVIYILIDESKASCTDLSELERVRKTDSSRNNELRVSHSQCCCCSGHFILHVVLRHIARRGGEQSASGDIDATSARWSPLLTAVLQTIGLQPAPMHCDI
jgi:hypothetical protein